MLPAGFFTYTASGPFHQRRAEPESEDRAVRFDVESNLGAVDRSVSSVEVAGQPARAVTLARSFDSTVEELWAAVTNADRIERWFLPVSGELEPGGRYQFEGNAGGVITDCERLSHFALIWEFGGDVSWVKVRLSEDDTQEAGLTLTHTAHLSEHWNTYGPGAVGVGWEMGLLGLTMHLADPAAPMPDPAAFAASPDGRALLTGSSERWGQAAIAAGTDAAVAQEAAAQTTAFYTGEPYEPA